MAQECRNEKALAGGTHSSGNCCRFTRHSLLIPLHGETIARQRYTFIGRKQAIRRNISAKRAPPLCAADRSDHDASLFRQTAETAVACRVIYDWQRADGTYGKQFVTDTYLLPERQLILASYRLAAVLNDLFG